MIAMPHRIADWIYKVISDLPLPNSFRRIISRLRQKNASELIASIRYRVKALLPALDLGEKRPSKGLVTGPDYYVAESGRDMIDYFQQVEENYRPLWNPFWYYHQIIDKLLNLGAIQIVPLYELQAVSSTGTRIIGLRHDVDANPLAALKCARHLARRGVCGSFYLLHTSPYYGDFHHGTFVRNPMMSQWVRMFIVTGCELGLHNDAFGVCKFHGKDGAESIRQELVWLRSLGAVIRGTVAHNSAPVYGAENYEVFSERVLWQREVKSPIGKVLPLGKLSEKQLGLSYEGTFAVPKRDLETEKVALFLRNSKDANPRSETWMRRYLLENPCCDWAIDYQFWLIGKDKWVAAGGERSKELFEWEIDLDAMLDLIRELPNDTRSVLVIHPEYFDAGLQVSCARDL